MRKIIRLCITMGIVFIMYGCCLNEDDKDDRPPVVSLTFPGKRSLTNGRNITIRGTASDTSGVREISIDGVVAETQNGFGTWEIDYSDLSIGITYLTVTAIDGTGRGDSWAASLNVIGVQNEDIQETWVGNGRPLSTLTPGMSVTISGDVYILDRGEYSIVGVDPELGHREALVAPDRIDGLEFVQAQCMAVEPGGMLIVVDYFPPNTIRVFRIDPQNLQWEELSNTDIDSGPDLALPTGAAIGSDGTIYVADNSNRTIIGVDPDNGERFLVSDGKLSPTYTPEMVAADPDGTLVIVDASNDTLLRIDPLTDTRTWIENDEILDDIKSIAVSDEGIIFISSYQSEDVEQWRISTCDHDGSTGSVISSSRKGRGPEPITNLATIALEPGGTILGIDSHSTRCALMRIDPISGDRVIISKGSPR